MSKQKNSNNHIEEYFNGIKKLSDIIEKKDVENLAKAVAKVKKRNGRIFFLGVGGSAGNSSHAVNDFRKLCKIESYTPTDNVSEFSARINDEGWDSSFVEWLKICRLSKKDAIFILSVGGGNIKKKVSVNLIEAIKYAKKKKSNIFGIVGKDGGFTKQKGDKVILIPTIKKIFITPYAESFQTIILHCLVSHPLLQKVKTKW